MNQSTKNILRSKQGFTLIELMVVVALLSIILLIIYMLWISMIRSTRMLDAKVKMRDEARTGLNHVIRNLRMASTRDTDELSYDDSDGNTVFWDSTDPWIIGAIFDNITFHRPVDADGDGTPFVEDTMVEEWSESITYTLDTQDVNEDGKTLQLVQIASDGKFMRLLIDDISPIFDSGTEGPYNTPIVDGVEFTGLAFTFIDGKTIEILVIQRRSLGPGMPTIVSRYEDRVTMRN